MRRAILTVAMSGVVIAFLSPLAYSALISLKTEEQISQPNSPILPSDPATFEFEGKSYSVYYVPMPGGTTRELALVKKAARPPSSWIRPTLAPAGSPGKVRGGRCPSRGSSRRSGTTTARSGA